MKWINVSKPDTMTPTLSEDPTRKGCVWRRAGIILEIYEYGCLARLHFAFIGHRDRSNTLSWAILRYKFSQGWNSELASAWCFSLAPNYES